MIQKYYYAFDSPNNSKFRHKSLHVVHNFRTLGWNITPVQQHTATAVKQLELTENILDRTG